MSLGSELFIQNPINGMSMQTKNKLNLTNKLLIVGLVLSAILIITANILVIFF